MAILLNKGDNLESLFFNSAVLINKKQNISVFLSKISILHEKVGYTQGRLYSMSKLVFVSYINNYTWLFK